MPILGQVKPHIQCNACSWGELPKSCEGMADGKHDIKPDDGEPFSVTCKGGWIVIQRRTSGDVDFYRPWVDYKTGFGDDENFWLGNDNIHRIAGKTGSKLRVELVDGNGSSGYAEYGELKIAGEADKYAISYVSYKGDIGDGLKRHQGMKFSTKDSDNDVYGSVNCALTYKGAWWYSACHDSNLNGMYHNPGHHDSYADGINWAAWRGQYHSMKSSLMMVKPANCLQAKMDDWCSNTGTDDNVVVGGDYPGCNPMKYARYDINRGIWRCRETVSATLVSACVTSDGVHTDCESGSGEYCTFDKELKLMIDE